MTLGLDLNDLGSDRLDWCRLRAVLTYLPGTSAMARSMHGAKATWSTTEHLLAAAVDALNAANWQRSGKKGGKPKPVPRPGDDPPKNEKRFGTASMPLDEARAFFDRVNRTTKPAVVEAPRMCSDDSCDRSDLKARGMCAAHYMRWWRAR